MAAWHWRFNISGTVAVNGRLGDWCRLLEALLRAHPVSPVGYFTGAWGVFASSTVADAASCGFDSHEVWVLAPGEPIEWRQFAGELGAALTAAGFGYLLEVHGEVRSRE